MDILEHSKLYDAYYYSNSCGLDRGRDHEWLAFYESIADRIVSEIHPASVLDTGCAMGILVEFLRERQVEAFGLDISEYAIRNVHRGARSYCWVGSVAESFPHEFDLIVCIEVLEHLPRFESEKAIQNLCRHSDDILFSSTPFDYKEGTHYNVQPPEYWCEAFAREGFFRDMDFDASFITPWAVRFRRQSKPVIILVRDYERKFFLLWKENVDLRELTIKMRHELASNEQKIDELSTQLTKLEQSSPDLPKNPSKPGVGSFIRLLLQKLKSMGFSPSHRE